MSYFGDGQDEAETIINLVEECIKKNGVDYGIDLVMTAVKAGIINCNLKINS